MPGGANISWINYTVTNPSIVKSTTNTTSNGTLGVTITSVTSGNLVVVALAHADDSAQPSPTSFTSSPSLTWTKRVDAQAASSGNAEIWTATASSTGNITITIVWESTGAGTGDFSASVYEISNADTAVGGASATATAQGTVSQSITTNRNNSILICVTSDWSATDGATRSYRDSATEVLYLTTAGVYTAYHYYKITSTSGSYTEGLTAPTGQAAGTCILEVRGN